MGRYLSSEEDRERSRRTIEVVMNLAAQNAQREIGWLIEGEGRQGEPIYYCLEPGDDRYWTHDAAKALRFARAVDAHNFAGLFLDNDDNPPCRVTEHFWG